jgi:F0F1-type ATP synthase alpha subunit
VLRELLKQERLAPVSAAGQLAWLLAFKHQLLEDLPPAEVAGTLARLLAGLADSGLDLGSPEADWLAWLRTALGNAS